MKKQELQVYRRQLQALAARLGSQTSGIRDEMLRTSGNTDGANFPTDQADVQTHESEEERTLLVLETEQELLSDVEAALDRIERGEFGQCEACRSAIAKKRLDAVPYARHCIACAK
jgi:DnaK suppressor protein